MKTGMEKNIVTETTFFNQKHLT